MYGPFLVGRLVGDVLARRRIAFDSATIERRPSGAIEGVYYLMVLSSLVS
jgi:hypothetical protein